MRQAPGVLTIFIALQGLLWAGGPNSVLIEGTAFRWDAARPVNFTIDNGPLGHTSRDEAGEIVRWAFEIWEKVSSSSLRFNDLGYLEENIEGHNYQSFFAGKERAENPILFDTDGTIIEGLLGSGSSQYLLGFAGARYVDSESGHYLSGWVILNGRQITDDLLRLTVLHEIGHFIGLGHTQAGHVLAQNTSQADNRFIPVMYPYLLSGGAAQPMQDDVAWLSWLYPELDFPSNTGSIRGRVLHGGEPLSGAHIVAIPVRRTMEGDLIPIPEGIVSALSDFLKTGDASYELPGLAPGDYVLYMEPIHPEFNGASAISPFQESFTGYIKDFYNGSKESDARTDDPDEKTIITVSAGETLSGIDFVSNEVSVDHIAGTYPEAGAPSDLIFPVSLEQRDSFESTFVGVAIVNPSTDDNLVTIAGMDARGQPIMQLELENPLAARAQSAFLTSHIVEPGQDAVSLMAEGAAGPIQGFFMVGDTALRKMDGVSGKLETSSILFFPLAIQTSGESTLLFLFNPDKAADSDVRLYLFDRSGNRLREASIAIAASGSFVGSLAEIFGHDLQLDDGYVEVVAGVPLKGFQFFGGPSGFSALTAQVPAEIESLAAPHFYLDGPLGSTEIRLLNTGPTRVTTTLKAFDDNSRLVGTRKFEIESRQLFVRDLADLLDLGLNSQGHSPLTGYLQLDAYAELAGLLQEQPQLIGAVSFAVNEGRARSILPLVEGGYPETLFLHVAQSRQLGLFTGFAILNLGDQRAEVSVRAFDEEGRQTAETELLIPPGHRVVDLLNSPHFFGSAFEQINGHIEISSSIPLITFGLFGDLQSQFLSAIQGQPRLTSDR
ncbi:MAG: matrixin family metalloprotease [Acidobacteriota bacterium]